jgi:hypothetical protein
VNDQISESPWTFAQARQKALDAESAQKKSEKRLAEAWKEYAESEKAYRMALSTRILRLKADGYAITACGDIARGHEDIADLKHLRDIAEGAREAAQAAVWRHKDNRKDARGFAQWSERRELAEGYGQVPEPEWNSKTGEIRPPVAA